MEKTHLLCTFAHRKDLNLIIDYITNSYDILEKKIYVFNNADIPTDLYCTYNVDATERYKKAQNTILIHRKKETNSLYTVNALNIIIKNANNGLLDKTFIVNWEYYNNMLLLTSNDDLQKIKLELYKRVDV